jgi:Rrf2 family transcriptional regulator, iron-sulfur cluster assembly transcription factor
VRLELTKRGDYAVRAALALARGDGRLMSVRQIAEEMAVPHRFLSQVMGDLHRAGLVDSVAGRAGGYLLARPGTEITLLEVVEAVEGDSRRETCVLRGGPCRRDGTCAVHDAFVAAEESVIERLGRETVTGLAAALDDVDVVGPGDPPETGEAAPGPGARG